MRLFIILLLVAFVLPDVTHAATEYATFESFYKEPFGMWPWLLAAFIALAAGALIFFTGGTASPIVAGIGSWIGGFMGLSGAAATNTGLALLGGGSIISGGLGMIGGTTLLTAALTFGTGIVIDYTISETISTYEYRNLTEKSKSMITLPLPINDSGPDVYENAMEILERIDKKSTMFSDSNQQVIHQSITAIKANQYTTDIDEQIKNNSLLSLLNFVSNDYVNAKKFAYSAIQSARELKIKRTLPAFIYATSSLYEERFDFKSTTNDYFRYSILAEPDNPLTPLLFSIYLDRMLLRFNDDFLDEKTLGDIFNIMQSPEIADYRILNYIILQSRYFIRLKLEQQKITSLANSSNEIIKNSQKTLNTVTKSLEKYDVLISGLSNVMDHFLSLQPDKIKANRFNTLLRSYTEDRLRLSWLVDGLRNYQDSLPKDTDDTNKDDSNWALYILLISLVSLIALGLVLAKKNAV